MSSSEPPKGITLSQYAGVIAGTQEGLSLEDVLENEAVDPGVWPQASQLWGDRLREDMLGEWTLDERFDEHLAEAQDRYGRRVLPLHDDLASWLDFVRIWGATEQPLSMLEELGLNGNDLIRLHRHWSKRLANEPSLQRVAFDVLRREPERLPIPSVLPAKPSPPRAPDPLAERLPSFVAVAPEPAAAVADGPPALDVPLPAPSSIALSVAPVGPAPVSPSIAARSIGSAHPPAPSDPAIAPTAAERSTDAPPPAPPPMTFLEYASYRAELAAMPERRDSTFAKYNLSDPETRAAADDYWRDRLEHDDEERADWQRAHDRMLKHWVIFNKKK